MPKSFSNLWPQVTAWDDLVTAYQRCRRRKRYKSDAAQFDYEWETNLVQLQRDLLDGSYRPGPYRHFHIQDPKPRKISAAPFRDRIVHHAVVAALEPIFERRFIHDSYACRRGKGTHRALDRAQSYLRNHRFFLKTDIVKFFPNVDHEVLLAVLSRSIRDERLMDLIRIIAASGEGVLADQRTPAFFPGDDLFAVLRPCGLPIGNLTSQFFANVLLDGIDHFVKEELRVPGYVRYADDLLLFADDKAQLWEIRDKLATRLAALRLKLHPDKTQVAPCSHGVGFLGFHMTPNRRRLLRSGLRRFNRRLRLLRWRFANGMIDLRRITLSLRAWLAHTSSARNPTLMRSLLRLASFQRPQTPKEKEGAVLIGLLD
ncbi:MAG: reverse transcriptase domain-containing protein [Planctomycetaceae bacterium]